MENNIKYYLENDWIFSIRLKLTLEKLEEASFGRKLLAADIYRRCNNFKDSIKIYEGLLKNLSNSEEEYSYNLYYSQLLIDIGDFKKAKEHLKFCINSVHKDTVPFIYLASVLMREEKTLEAIDVLTISLNLSGDLDEVYYNLATCYSVSEMYSMAIKCVTKCLEISPDFKNAAILKEDLENVLLL